MRLWADVTRPQPMFDAATLEEVFAALGTVPEDSAAILLETPDIAENGAVVPVSVTSNIPGTERVYVMVEMNPNPLAAMFVLPEGAEPFVQSRVKMAQTSNIYGVVYADGKYYKTARETKVTLGGCGG
jgi:sulfur-oxidizing protein SoxY